MVDLSRAFEALVPPATAPASGIRFSAVPIESYERHRLGKDAHGAPSLLLSVVDPPNPAWATPIVLEHLAVQRDVECRVSRPDGTIEEGRFTVVRCTDSDPVLHSFFLRVAAPLVALLGADPAYGEVSRAIDRLVELFRAMARASERSIQGLWAELFLMTRSRDSSTLLAAWHTQPNDRYDFSAGSQRIEIKSASSHRRQHYFSLEQLLPIPQTQVLIASVIVERAGAGRSLAELIELVRSRVSGYPDLLLHLDQTVGITLGERWRSALEERFDQEVAENSLAFFEPAAIPKVDANLPPSVSDVRFRTDLGGVPTADLKAYRALGGLFRAALRR